MDKEFWRSPGFQLREIFKRLFPYQPQPTGFLFKIDQSIHGDQQFAKLSYNSSLNYLLRRMIVGADFIKRRYDNDDYSAERYLKEIKKYLRSAYDFPGSELNNIYDLLIEALKERNKTLSTAKKQAVMLAGEKKALGCYICGKALIYHKKGYPEDHDDLVEVEHIWPQSLGGSNELYNLEVCCHACNNSKTDHIDFADYHYEKFFVVKNRGDAKFFSDFKKHFIVAGHLQNGCQCQRCRKKAINQNQLYLNRRDESEGWHFLNMQSYCADHTTNKHDSI